MFQEVPYTIRFYGLMVPYTIRFYTVKFLDFQNRIVEKCQKKSLEMAAPLNDAGQPVDLGLPPRANYPLVIVVVNTDTEADNFCIVSTSMGHVPL